MTFWEYAFLTVLWTFLGVLVVSIVGCAFNAWRREHGYGDWFAEEAPVDIRISNKTKPYTIISTYADGRKKFVQYQPKPNEVECPDCGEYLGPGSWFSYSCHWCRLRVFYDHGTPEHPKPLNISPYFNSGTRQPLLLVRDDSANCDHQLEKPREELVYILNNQFFSVKVIRGALPETSYYHPKRMKLAQASCDSRRTYGTTFKCGECGATYGEKCRPVTVTSLALPATIN
jgi:hypothetical protein